MRIRTSWTIKACKLINFILNVHQVNLKLFFLHTYQYCCLRFQAFYAFWAIFMMMPFMRENYGDRGWEEVRGGGCPVDPQSGITLWIINLCYSSINYINASKTNPDNSVKEVIHTYSMWKLGKHGRPLQPLCQFGRGVCRVMLLRPCRAWPRLACFAAFLLWKNSITFLQTNIYRSFLG